MNPNEFHQMYKYLVRPSREKVVAAAKKELGIPQEAKINNGTEILDWINYNQKAYGDNTQPMTPEERKTGESIEKTIAWKLMFNLKNWHNIKCSLLSSAL